MMVSIRSLIACLLITLPLGAHAYQANHLPVVSDTRIKTLVYNPNEVFNITTHFGFQSNIEFGKFEKVRTISVGDQSTWRIIPAGRHLFIRPLTHDTRTNMTVITNKRIYQFDLIAPRLSYASFHFNHEEEGEDAAQTADIHRNAEIEKVLPNLSYVIRFYYPEEEWDSVSQPVAMEVQQPVIPQAVNQTYNTNYSISGQGVAAPLKVYDDGYSTYFHFAPNTLPPSIFLVGADGIEIPVQQNMQGNMITIPSVSSRYSIRSGNEVVCVFNESLAAGF